MSDINTTPLVDVMLVLLIIFLIAVPVVLQTVPVQLPAVRYRGDHDQAGKRQPVGSRRPRRNLRGLLEPAPRSTSEELLDRAVKKLEDQIKDVGGVENVTEENMPEAHIRGDINTPLQVHRRRHLHHAARRFRAGRFHFRAAGRAGVTTRL